MKLGTAMSLLRLLISENILERKVGLAPSAAARISAPNGGVERAKRALYRSTWASSQKRGDGLPPTNSRSSSSLLLARDKSARAIGLIHEIERGVAAADAAKCSTTGMSRPGSAGSVPSDS